MNSSWRATVASSILILSSLAGVAQPSSVRKQNKLTISFHDQPLEKVLEEITQKTGIDFVYSANNINPDKLISYSAVQLPLDDILLSIGRQMSLSFKWFGDHVVVKKIQTFTQPITIADQVKKITKTETEIKEQEFNPALDTLMIHASTKRNFDHPVYSKPLSFSSLSINDKINTRSKLDSLILSSLSLPNEKGKTSKPSFLFASIGLFVNDYTYTGLEVRMGTRAIHGIFNASIVNNELSRVGYGIGTYFPSSSKHWSLSLDYTLSKLKKQNDLTITEHGYINYTEYYRYIIYEDVIELRSTQHQVKVQAHYAFSQNVSVRFGPTVNILNTRYRVIDEDISINTTLEYGPPFDRTQINLSPYLKSSNTIIPPYTIFSYYSPDLFVNTKLWVGFEAGINWRINFPSAK